MLLTTGFIKPMVINEGILLSIFGGIGIQLYSLIGLYKIQKKRRPDFKDLTYYIPWVLNPLFASLIGYAYFKDQENVNSLLAIHIGASASLIFKTMINNPTKEVIAGPAEAVP